MINQINSPKNTVAHREFSRRHFLGASVLGAMAGVTAISDPIKAAAQSADIKPGDLPDLTIKEVKVYVADIGNVRRINGGESGEICSIVTAGGIEGNFTLGNRVPGTGWLEYAKSVCLGKSVVDVLPTMAAGRGAGPGGARGGVFGAARGGAATLPRGGGAGIATDRTANGFVGGFGYPNGMKLGSRPETNYHASIVDICLWDILGKAVNRPIYKLPGRKQGPHARLRQFAASGDHRGFRAPGPPGAKRGFPGL